MKASLLLMLAVVAFSACSKAGANTLDPPIKMDALKAAKLDAALAHYREVSMQEKPYMDIIQSICGEYKINPQELGRTVNVDFTTGDIQRAQRPLSPIQKDQMDAQKKTDEKKATK